MKRAEFMVWYRSLKKIQKLFPSVNFLGFENSFGDKCWIYLEFENEFQTIRTLLKHDIKIMIYSPIK